MSIDLDFFSLSGVAAHDIATKLLPRMQPVTGMRVTEVGPLSKIFKMAAIRNVHKFWSFWLSGVIPESLGGNGLRHRDEIFTTYVASGRHAENQVWWTFREIQDGRHEKYAEILTFFAFWGRSSRYRNEFFTAHVATNRQFSGKIFTRRGSRRGGPLSPHTPKKLSGCITSCYLRRCLVTQIFKKKLGVPLPTNEGGLSPPP